jgi:hypothetical protein
MALKDNPLSLAMQTRKEPSKIPSKRYVELEMSELPPASAEGSPVTVYVFGTISSINGGKATVEINRVTHGTPEQSAGTAEKPVYVKNSTEPAPY